ncbi:bifunctional YncE family protein/alkaline phosphatase family protein [Paenibacillus filicis]|uniref:Bifunctional YncE family protein/alkaline phosphatase family protein n=1 Tax=Paenibacillus gyeongsangnamensis TaxID=3388067 RepID=A0ABT4QJP8_9BACL|nr:bifunctional YncE family protein/alkaline phosphatase family protein [Paenibacillus filicis]MCZ8516925.1 bifunctional YncE family protein/alkaline phosphatase family protein [Paenibacillus filicis]
MKKVKVSKKLIATTLATLLLGSSTAFAAYNVVAGPQANGTGVTPLGWTVTPAGKQLSLGEKPFGGVVSPDHQYLIVSNDGVGPQSLQVVDIKQEKVVQTISYNSPESLYIGVAFSPDGKKLYASAGDNQKIRVYNFDNGTLTEQSPILMKDQNNTNFYPTGVTVSPDGKFLYVANNMNKSVSQIDLSSGQISATIPVGKDPYMVLVSHDGNSLYVTNWGESSVSVLDIKSLTVKKTISVGLHPNALAENPVNGLVYAANSDSDEISVVDSQSQQVVQTISLAPYRNAPTGSTPDALAVSQDGKTLYVANAGNNDIAVVDLGDGATRTEATVKGLIPTAWYPTGVYLSGDGKLMVLNAKGLGAGPNPKHTFNLWTPESQYIGSLVKGTMSFIDLPDNQQLKEYTRQVEDNNKVYKAEGEGWFSKLNGNNDFPIPQYADQHSPIKHVIYVVKENRTYDQVFGDMGKGNGDPNLTLFGKDVTPNLHKLANQFVLLDNFYSNGEVSDNGHEWVTAAQSNDHMEKGWPIDYSFSRKSQLDPEAINTKEGRIWANANRSGVSFRDYGEYINWWSSYDKTKGRTPDDPSIGNNFDPNYAGWDINTSDLTRYNEWENEFKQFDQNGNLPQLETVYLPDDHTAFTAPGKRTPQAYVATNDYALGKLVDTVSHSKYWKDTAIVVVEDDPQDGPDHVSASRTEALVISPYTQTGKVDSTLYSQVSMVRTVEMILGMKPMTQFDAAAIPMLNAFTNHPNFKSYSVEQPKYPLDQLNGQPAPAPAATQSSQASDDFSKPDTGSADSHNRELWKGIKGDQPYPESKN